MHFLLSLLFISISFLYGNGDNRVFQKLLLKSYKSEKIAQETLLTLKVYFSENSLLRAIKDKNNITLKLEKMEDYYIIVATPILDVDIRNELTTHLQGFSKNIFYINEKGSAPVLTKVEPLPKNEKKEGSREILKKLTKSVKDRFWVEELPLQWFTLLMLSILGLGLSLINRNKLKKFKEEQELFTTQQNKVENEMKQLGVYRV